MLHLGCVNQKLISHSQTVQKIQLYCSDDNCSLTSGSLWNYYRDDVNYDAHENYGDCYTVNNEKTTTTSKHVR